jgi:hypothetical protein
MSDTAPFKPLTVYDAITTVEAGMNSGLDPLLIPKNQLSFASNMTCRNGFAMTRPPFTKNLTITYPSDEVQTAIEQGLFQGAAYYQPDSGSQSLFASISGRLFQFVVSTNGITVVEQTIPGDPNPAASTQAWLWQSENYLIVNDGVSLPIFFDGVSSRRSAGPSVPLAITDATVYNVPPIGQDVTVTLTLPYTGPYNVPVILNGEYYQPSSATGYEVQLTSLFSNPGEVISVNDQINIIPSIAGVVANPLTFTAGTPFDYNTLSLNITLTAPYTGAINTLLQFDYGKVILFGKVWFVVAASGNTITVTAGQPGTLPATLASGTVIQYSASSAPNVLVAFVGAASVAPGIFGTVQLQVGQDFTGTPGQIVYLGTGQYTIVSVPPTSAGGSMLRLLNLSDPGATATPAGTFTSAPILSVPELPAGRMGCYGLGQNWVALVDGLSFICSDISRGPSGTQANNYRDAVLKTTDLTFRGGSFAIPGAGNVITSMTFTTNLDQALGQGSLMVGTAQFMASCLAPIDFNNPPTNGPILTFSLVGTGPVAQNSTIRVNSDIYFRSIQGIGSLILARRDFDTPGNTPISQEMNRVLDPDNKTLLNYGSAIVFNNRFLITVSPQASSQGVLHAGLIALNLDPVSGMRNKQPPVYDGLWTGINTLQLVAGIFNGSERAFAFTFNNALSKIELYEILPTAAMDNRSVPDPAQYFDNGNMAITWSIETASLFREDIKSRDTQISLRGLEFAVSDLIGTVRFELFFKADDGCWTPWHAFSICSNSDSVPQYYPRLSCGEPSSALCDPIMNYPLRDGYTFQFKFIISGICKLVRARVVAVTIPTPRFQPPQCDVYATATVPT